MSARSSDGSSVPDPQAVPSALERTLGRLVAAGITRADDLASSLGLEPLHIRRPLTQLSLAGLLDRDPSGSMQLTSAGRAWLGNEATSHEREPVIASEDVAAARLVRRQRVMSEARTTAEAEIGAEAERRPPAAVPISAPGGVRAVSTVPATAPTSAPVRRVAVAWRRLPATTLRTGRTGPVAAVAAAATAWLARWMVLSGSRAAVDKLRVAAAGVWLALPAVQLTLNAVELSTFTGRQLAAVAAAAVALMAAAQLGLAAWPVSTGAPSDSAGVPVHTDLPGLEPAAAVAPVATPPPPAGSAVERWVVVSHTDGLGLVLRTAPAAAGRVLTLKEGARLRVTGESVQQAGRGWLPVAAQGGRTGWVASEFVRTEP